MKGEILGERYQVEQLLGKKAGRRTFLAQDLQSNQPVVIKLLTFSNDFEWDDLKLFEREAETLKSLNHPAIPRYLDYFEVSLDTVKGFALVQNYIEAKTLEQYLKAGRTFTESEVKEIASSLLEILIYLHSQNPPVIHRDIKPSNILLSDRSGNSVGKVYLVDFGSVQTVAAKEGGTMTVVGTYGYMAPEQFGGRAVPASDIYSLGATLIYLVTGSHPADLPQVDLKIEFEDQAKVSKEFVEWLKLMTLPSLNQRYSSASDTLEILLDNKLYDYKAFETSSFLPLKGSSIIVKNQKEFLEIIIPPPVIIKNKFMKLIAKLLAFCTPTLVVFSFFIILYSIFIGINAIAFFRIIGFSLMYSAILLPLGYLVFLPFHKLVEQKRILINSTFITTNYGNESTVFNLNNTVSRQYISNITLTKHSKNIQEISIYVGFHKFLISRANHLSEAEITWLANLLSSALDRPIYKEENNDK
ncbi:serine/threonine protein kinase [Dulcicalothrix desertica]|nr:serine/threonine-protein kinase [Dulcicalothrix desertica]TWH40479.1 serine/threonine protein kinase [Dulcicalothrix desertica PCC 7102]